MVCVVGAGHWCSLLETGSVSRNPGWCWQKALSGNVAWPIFPLHAGPCVLVLDPFRPPFWLPRPHFVCLSRTFFWRGNLILSLAFCVSGCPSPFVLAVSPSLAISALFWRFLVACLFLALVWPLGLLFLSCGLACGPERLKNGIEVVFPHAECTQFLQCIFTVWSLLGLAAAAVACCLLRVARCLPKSGARRPRVQTNLYQPGNLHQCMYLCPYVHIPVPKVVRR